MFVLFRKKNSSYAYNDIFSFTFKEIFSSSFRKRLSNWFSFSANVRNTPSLMLATSSLWISKRVLSHGSWWNRSKQANVSVDYLFFRWRQISAYCSWDLFNIVYRSSVTHWPIRKEREHSWSSVYRFLQLMFVRKKMKDYGMTSNHKSLYQELTCQTND